MDLTKLFNDLDLNNKIIMNAETNLVQKGLNAGLKFVTLGFMGTNENKNTLTEIAPIFILTQHPKRDTENLKDIFKAFHIFQYSNASFYGSDL